MKHNLLIKQIKGSIININDLEHELYEICEGVHAQCDSSCPVYWLNGNKAPDTAQDFEVNRGCDCFKSGPKMLEFIKQRTKEGVEGR